MTIQDSMNKLQYWAILSIESKKMDSGNFHHGPSPKSNTMLYWESKHNIIPRGILHIPNPTSVHTQLKNAMSSTVDEGAPVKTTPQ